MIINILLAYIPSERAAKTGSDAPATGKPAKEEYISSICFSLLKYLAQYISYIIIRTNVRISHPIQRDRGLILQSLKIRSSVITRASPILSNIRSTLFSFLLYSSYPSGLCFVQIILGISSIAIKISPMYEKPKFIFIILFS